MSLPTSNSTPDFSAPTLQRRIGLRSAVLFNMLEMIGVGPFITLPLVIAAAGYRLSVWAWVVGAGIAVADGLVWAELGAAFPQAGGSYAFLREIYGPKGAGNWLSFLYVWQLSFTAPLSIASGCIGLSSFLAFFWPRLDGAPLAALPALHYANFAAAVACLLVTALLYRNLTSITRLAWVLFVGVLAAIAGVIASGFAHAAAMGGWQMPATPSMSLPAALGGLAQATLITTYCYWGYYNICFLGGEVRRPEDLPTVMRRAFRVAQRPPTGPVMVSLPLDVLAGSLDFAYPVGGHSFTKLRPDERAVQVAADELAAARRSLLQIFYEDASKWLDPRQGPASA